MINILVLCIYPRWQQWCNIKLAHRLVFIFVGFWILYNIPYLIYYNHVIIINTNKVTCQITNNIFNQYTAYGNIVILGKILPLFITFLFGFLAYRNVRQLSHRTVPLVRRELDKQLTIMVLVQVIVAVFTLVPNAIVYPFTMVPQFMQDPFISAKLQFAIFCDCMPSLSLFCGECISDKYLSEINFCFLLFRVHFIYISVCLNDFVDN